jgi:hypothetical protein
MLAMILLNFKWMLSKATAFALVVLVLVVVANVLYLIAALINPGWVA